MNITIDPKTQEVKLNLEKKDVQDAFEIQKMTETKGWKIFKDYLEVAREGIIDSGKDGISTRAKRDLSDIKFAVLKGFDSFALLPERIVERANKFIKDQNEKEEEVKYGSDDD